MLIVMDGSENKGITVEIRTEENLRVPGVTQRIPKRDGNTALFLCVVSGGGYVLYIEYLMVYCAI